MSGFHRSNIVYWDNRHSHTYMSAPEYFDIDEDGILDMSDEEGDETIHRRWVFLNNDQIKTGPF